MSKRDLAYRSITKTLYDELGCDIASAIPEFRFSDAAGETHLLACNFDSRAFYVDDENANWNPNENDLEISLSFGIENTSILFEGEDKVAYRSSQLSVALFLVAGESADQRLFALCPLQNVNQRQIIKLSGRLERGKYHGTADFSVKVILTKPGEEEPEVFGVNNTKGIILGTLGSFKIRITGQGTSFPVYEKESENAGLWSVECNWDNPEIDEFDQTFKLILNPRHPDYAFIDRKSKLYCKRLENEIMAEALAIFLCAVLNNCGTGQTLSGKYPEGSVASVAQYMIEAKSLRIDDPNQSLLHQIVLEFEKGAKNDR